jgi:hypothetical protein
MKHSPRVIITVNPGLIEGKRYQTIRTLVTALDGECDLIVAPIDGYDYAKRKISAYRRVPGGKFEKIGMQTPQADLWIVYTDGYYLDWNALGFNDRNELLDAQFTIHEECLSNGSVRRMINTPRAERHTLKAWFTGLDLLEYNIPETYTRHAIEKVNHLLARDNCLIAKPSWGGGMVGVHKIDTYEQLVQFAAREDYIFQEFLNGPEKRLWFLGDQVVAARVIHDRPKPWQKKTNSRIEAFTERLEDKFANEIAAAKEIWRRAGLEVGCVDFIGEKINELNGCGTLFTQYDGMRKIIDVRQKLNDYMISQARQSTAR